MEFEKLQGIIAEVLNLESDEISPNATFEIPNEAAEKIVTVGDAAEAIKNAMN